jgi:hypothetical protein
MSSKQFAYWLHGYAELNPGQPPTQAQWELIVAHLDLVFDKVTPGLHRVADAPSAPEVIC